MIHSVLEVTEAGNTVSYANVLKAYEDIKLEELLASYQEVVEPLSANSVVNFLEGYIVVTKMDKIGVGITDIVYIDNGWEDSINTDDVFEVYQVPEIKKKA